MRLGLTHHANRFRWARIGKDAVDCTQEPNFLISQTHPSRLLNSRRLLKRKYVAVHLPAMTTQWHEVGLAGRPGHGTISVRDMKKPNMSSPPVQKRHSIVNSILNMAPSRRKTISPLPPRGNLDKKMGAQPLTFGRDPIGKTRAYSAKSLQRRDLPFGQWHLWKILPPHRRWHSWHRN